MRIRHARLLACAAWIAVSAWSVEAQELVRSDRLFGDKVGLSERLLTGKPAGAWSVYDKDTTEKGIALTRQGGEGKVEIVESGGRYAAGMVDSQIPGAHYFYFKLAEKPKDGPVEIAIEFFDGTKGSVVLAYDAKESGFKPCPAIELTGGQTWNVVVYRINDWQFSGRCNGADFRVGNAPQDFAIGAVALLPQGEFERKQEGR